MVLCKRQAWRSGHVAGQWGAALLWGPGRKGTGFWWLELQERGWGLAWRVGTTLSISPPPWPGSPRLPGDPPISLSIFSFFPRIYFKLSLISSHQHLYFSEKIASTKTPLLPIFMLLTPRSTSLVQVFSPELQTLMSTWMSHRHKIFPLSS